MRDPLYRNSLYNMASTVIVAILGFFFWIVVARLFPPQQVGIATSLVSLMALLSNFSLLGFNMSLIRYLPKSQTKNEKINSSLLLIIIASIIASTICLLGLNIFSPKLAFLQTNLFYLLSFILSIVALSVNIIIDSIFIAYRSSGNILLKSAILSLLKLLFPLAFIFLGAYGIFSSITLATLISALIGIGILMSRFNYKPNLSFNMTAVREMAAFSGGNYIAGFLALAPTLILPLIIINKLSAATAAYYYIASMILGFFTVILGNVNNALVAEGSYNKKELRKHFYKAVKMIFVFLVPAILLIVLFGDIILSAFGKSYADEAFTFLRIISISALFMAISTLVNSILKIRQQIRELILIDLFGAVVILLLAYLLIDYGLIGVGWGWLLGQFLLSLLCIFVVAKEKIVFIFFKGIGRRK